MVTNVLQKSRMEDTGSPASALQERIGIACLFGGDTPIAQKLAVILQGVNALKTADANSINNW